MLKVYALIFIVGILGTVGYGAKYYYDSTQATIATLRENNAKLETAIEISEASIEALQQDMAKFQELNSKLQQDLQAAEAYGDELQGKLNRMDLVQDAIKDAKTLEGKMNGATAKLWRGIIEDTGGDASRPLPDWLQPLQPGPGAGDQGSDQDRKDNSADSEPTQASTAQ
jgi:FtsZ-binding cell division protein ZapB